MMMMMTGVGIFAGLIGLLIYIGIPIIAILLILWVYRIKQNSDIQVEQNKEIIAWLKKMNDK